MVLSHGGLLFLLLPLLVQVTCAFVKILPKKNIYSNYNISTTHNYRSTTSFAQGIFSWAKNARSLPSRAASSSDVETITSNKDDNTGKNELEVVLFGVGDLRIQDHEGLCRAISKCHESIESTSGNKILFLFVLDEDLLRNIPGMSIHTIDTGTILWSALQSMDQSLRQLLYCNTTSTDTQSPIQFYVGNTLTCMETLITPSSSAFRSITIHVCDLGEADNSMKYNPYSALLPFLDENNQLQMPSGNPAASSTSTSSLATTATITVKPWTSRLREEPWEHLSTLPDTYTKYRDTYISSSRSSSTAAPTIQQPLPIPLLPHQQANLTSICYLPNSTQFTSMDDWIAFLTKHINYNSDTLNAERHTGLFGTHWGSIHPNYCSEQDVHSCWDLYNGKEEEFWKSEWYQSRTIAAPQPNTSNNDIKLYGNERSLEHAAINWMINNNYPEDTTTATTAVTTTKNLMDGELFLRYMAAPLLLGCISIRQLHYYATMQQTPNGYKNKNSNNNRWLSIMPSSAKTFRSLLTAAESREWHNLFAASCLLKQKLKYQYKKETISFQYWRWQGFLCRYITTASSSSTDHDISVTPHNDETTKSPTISTRQKLGLILLHGFGANGGQWEKMITEIYQRWDTEAIPYHKIEEEADFDDTLSSIRSAKLLRNDVITFAPDLIGFGQSEKPFITYTQYLWESYASAFVKEIVFRRRRMTTTVAESSTVQNYIIGGNSIGGYTAMACAADDSTCTNAVHHDGLTHTPSKENIIAATASGSPGINRCIGLVLFNSAGRILTKQDVEGKQQLTVGPSLSIAQATSLRRLPKCR